MRPRDLIVVGAVVLVAGFAAADALRGPARTVEAAPTETGQTGPTRLPSPEPPAEAPDGWPSGTLAGSLVFTDAEGCRVRAVRLATGRELSLARFTGTCELWAAPAGQRVAYGLGPSSADGFVPFKLADLGAPELELGGYRALFGVVLWSQDGERVAWCGRARIGFDLVPGGPARRLPRCPAAYTLDGRIAYAVGNELIVDDEVVLRAEGGITYVQFGMDGSVAVVVDGETIERWEGDRLTGAARIPAALQGRTPVFRPDNCAAALPPQEDFGRIGLVDLGCVDGLRDVSILGRDAAWSPDGAWLAFAAEDAIFIRRLVGPEQVVRWPATAVELAWRPD